METKKKKEYTGMKAEKIEFNNSDIIATSGLSCGLLAKTYIASISSCYRQNVK